MNYGNAIVGRVKWKKYSKQCLINIFVTVSDEVITLIALDNSDFVWEDQASKHDTIPAPKYTCNRAHRRVKDGWSYEGRNKFNYYFNLVRENRMTTKREKFETLYLSEASHAVCASITSDGSQSFVKIPHVITKDELAFPSEYSQTTTTV